MRRSTTCTTHAKATIAIEPNRTGMKRNSMCAALGVTTMISAVAAAGGCRQRSARITIKAKAIASIAAMSGCVDTSEMHASPTTAERNCPAITFHERETVMPGSINRITTDAAKLATNSEYPIRSVVAIEASKSAPIAKALATTSIGEMLNPLNVGNTPKGLR